MNHNDRPESGIQKMDWKFTEKNEMAVVHLNVLAFPFPFHLRISVHDRHFSRKSLD
jgi:hypothetical protein